MRTTVTLEDDLLIKARRYTGILENSGLVNEALKALVEREAAHRLIALGGTMPGSRVAPRRRPAASRRRRTTAA